MKIFYLEDDIELSNTVSEYLIDEGFNIVCSYDGEDALEKLYENNFDLLLLDVNVPHMDGFLLLESLRKADILTPAIFITSLDSINDLSHGYEIGADDYIKKPFVLKELLFRIKALLKREYKLIENSININDQAQLNLNKKAIIIGNTIYPVHEKEILLLKLLVANKNNCVLFDQIYETLWSFNETHSEQSLRTYIKNLRKIIGKETIISIKKQGYKLV